MIAGVLALQGDFEAHAAALKRACADLEVIEVRSQAELERISGLIIPGGESTSMLKLMEYYNLVEPLKAFGARKPIFGTCAGAILMASEVKNPSQPSLALLDMTIERNAYGRQLQSRVATLDGGALEPGGDLEAVFIRAPIIRHVGPAGTVLARYKDDPVLVDFGSHLVATFHPELSADARVHRLFVGRLRR